MALLPPKKISVLLISLIWLLIPAINMTGRLFLGPLYFAYREWEFMTATDGPGPFKPSTVFQGTIYGDLANMLHISSFRRYRHQVFSTDSAGFRNPEFPPGTYFPVVVIGDSDMAGSSQTDKETFSQLLSRELNVHVYNYAPASILSFFTDPRFQKSPPNVVIWEAIERTITAGNFRGYASLPAKVNFVKKKPTAKKKPPLPRLTDFWAKNLYHEVAWRLSGQHENAIGYIDHDSQMLFYSQGIQTLQQSADQRDINEVVKGIERIRQLLADRGIDLIFLPLPDKENVYQELLPTPLRSAGDSVFLEELNTRLDKQGINNVNLYTPFRAAASTFLQSRQENDSLYFLDDTHWNGHGVSLAVHETKKRLPATLTSNQGEQQPAPVSPQGNK